MNLLGGLERKIRRFALPNVTLYLIVGQTFFYLMWQLLALDIMAIALIPRKVLEGEVWRLITFLFSPPITNPLFAFFAWYLFYIMGTALEHYWGVARYNLYLLIAYVASVAVSFLFPDAPSTNGYIGGSVFLAFAFVNPDFQLYLFFILPVKIKWLALLTWIWYFGTVVFGIVFGNWLMCLLVLASVSNFLLFFYADIIRKMKAGRKRMEDQADRFSKQKEPFHVCTVCGITDLTHPDMDFRYCPDCHGTHGYCCEHINNHEHIGPEEDTGG